MIDDTIWDVQKQAFMNFVLNVLIYKKGTCVYDFCLLTVDSIKKKG